MSNDEIHHIYILDENGEPQSEPDLLKWAAQFESSDRHVALTEVSDAVRVSTVFLGLDHSFGQGPPLLYETMIFGGKHDRYQDRYATRDEALAGHTKAVKLATETPSSEMPDYSEHDRHVLNIPKKW